MESSEWLQEKLRWWINYNFDATTNTKWCENKNCQKRKCRFSPNPVLLLNKTFKGIAIEDLKRLQEKLRWGINFRIDITWTQDKVKVTNLRKLPNIPILEFLKQLNTRHIIFWSCLIRCINMKWIDGSYRADTILSAAGRTDGQRDTRIPRFSTSLKWEVC